MNHLVLLNGAPGVGKSTTACALAQATPGMSAWDVDVIKHAVPAWSDDPLSAGLDARRAAVGEIERCLARGESVVAGQYLPRTEFIEELEAVAARSGATFVEVILELDAAALAARIAQRVGMPTRGEHSVNNELVRPQDAQELVQSLEPLRLLRPRARWIAAERLDQTLSDVRTLLAGCRPDGRYLP